ncbi:WD40-repeat-containing domain protein, partial [Mycena galopus ATCC 62051]
MLRLGPSESLTINNNIYGGKGGPGGTGHGQGQGGHGGHGEAPTLNYNITLDIGQQNQGQQEVIYVSAVIAFIFDPCLLVERTKFNFLDKLNYAKDARVQRSKGCLPGTRVKLLSRIQEWALHPTAERTLLLHGAAGKGKSVIAHTIAKDMESKGLAVVPFFAFNCSVQSRSPSQLIPTWAKHLAEWNSQYLSYLQDLKSQELESMDLADQQDVPFIKGLASGIDCGQPLIFTIDALNECPQHMVHDLFSSLGALISEPTLPAFVRFFFTYRSDGKILGTFTTLPGILSIGIDNEEGTAEDILKFVSNQLCNTKGSNMVDDVAKAAQTLFECAAVLCRELTRPRPMLSSVRQEFILRLREGQIKSLYSSYHAILEMYSGEDNGAVEVFRQVMAWIFLVKSPQSHRVFSTFSSALLSEENKSDPDEILTYLGSPLSGTTSEDDPISPLHTSLRDFLLDAKESGIFSIDLGSHAHEEIAQACFKIMNNGLQFNICMLPTSFALNSDIIDLPQKVAECISPGLRYSCLAAGYHLKVSLPSASTTGQVYKDKTVSTSSVGFFVLEMQCCTQDLMNKSLETVVLDFIRFEKRFRQGYMASAPQIYISGLVFCPRESIISQWYCPMVRNLIHASGALDVAWPPGETGVMQGMGCVSSVAFSPDGKQIASGSYKTIQIWDVAIGQQVGEALAGHTDQVNSVAFSPDGTHIASGSADKTTRIWDVVTGQQVGEALAGHTNEINSVAFSPDGTHIVSGSDDETIQIWDVATGQQVGKALAGHTYWVNSVAFSPGGTHIASGSSDMTIRIWDVATGQQVGKPLAGHTNRVNCVAFSPNGTHIASGSADNTIRIWDVATGEQVGEALARHTNRVNSVAYSPDGTHIASGSDDKTIRIWDVATGQQVSKALAGHTDFIRSVAFSPGGTHIASGSSDMTIRIWDVA